MQSNFHVGLSAQLSLQRRLDTIANNVANASTAGFRAEEVKFDTLLSQASNTPVAFASAGQHYLSRTAGEIVRTDNPFDVAVQGDAWLAMQTPAGTVYTRDGRMKMTPAGELQTLSGYAILDAGGAPVQLDPNAGPPQVARDGAISQNNRTVGALGLFKIDDTATLRRFDNSGVTTDRPATAVVDFTKAGLHQGFVEGSNVNPVMEMSRLIMVSRAFDAVTSSIKDADSSQQEAIRSLGATS
ncbi:MAG TPA: flagellar basal-body rod protein FlgF [Hyphomicrobiaceae bacterium]|nr:flagellar basal-body rod protein FlgF [Hyphomicrobiaceae bacterium]